MPLARTRHRCEVNIKMDLEETGWAGVECINLAQVRVKKQAVVNTVMNLWVLYNDRNFFIS